MYKTSPRWPLWKQKLKQKGSMKKILKFVNMFSKSFHLIEFIAYTGKSLSEALILAVTNPQCVKRLFIKLQVQYMKTTTLELQA